VAVVVLVAAPLLSLSRYYAKASRADPTNASLIRAMNDVKSALRPGDVVLLDWNLNTRRLVSTADPLKDEASVFRVFRYIMEFDRIAYEKDPTDDNAFDDRKRTTIVDEATLSRWAASGQHGVVILDPGFDSKDTAKIGQWIEQFGLTGLDGTPAKPPRPNDRFGLYRFDPAASGGRP
jgi:hypothetical protein